MTVKDTDDPLLERIKESLDQQTDELDAATLSRLRQARARAVEEMDRKQQRFKPGAIWAGGFATAALAVTLVLVWPGNNTLPPEFAQEVADIELLSDDHSIEFYEELDFYLWLEQQEQETDEV